MPTQEHPVLPDLAEGQLKAVQAGKTKVLLARDGGRVFSTALASYPWLPAAGTRRRATTGIAVGVTAGPLLSRGRPPPRRAAASESSPSARRHHRSRIFRRNHAGT